ncbi:transposase [Streptomyces olivoreticuli]
MGARLGKEGNRQALAHFHYFRPWDPAHVRARLSWKTEPAIRPIALIIDDTGFLKDRDASACVSRQHTGTAGKVTNCQAGVYLHLTSARASAAVDWRLFLPEPWDPASPKADRVTVARRECGIPASVGMQRSGSWPWTWSTRHSRGHRRAMAVADGGNTAAFCQGLEERGLHFVVGASTTVAHPGGAVPSVPLYSGTAARLRRVTPTLPGVRSSRSSTPDAVRADPCGGGRAPVRAPAAAVSTRMYGRFVVLRIRPAGRRIRKISRGPELPAWKQALGLAHFEGHTWNR